LLRAACDLAVEVTGSITSRSPLSDRELLTVELTGATKANANGCVAVGLNRWTAAGAGSAS
jgi:hypothetical protein